MRFWCIAAITVRSPQDVNNCHAFCLLTLLWLPSETMARRYSESVSRGEAVTKLKKSGAEPNLKVICTRLMTADEIRVVLARRADALARRDAAGAAANYSDDCVVLSELYGPGNGRAYAENVFRMFFNFDFRNDFSCTHFRKLLGVGRLTLQRCEGFIDISLSIVNTGV
jgi:hypothetical protein